MAIDPREQASLDLKTARADAIHNYATIEQALCMLLGTLLGTTYDLAGVIYYNIIASRSRNKIFEQLIKKRLHESFHPYWLGIKGTSCIPKQPGLFALIQQLDTTRNFIVHWSIAVNVGDGSVTESLVPPNIWDFEEHPRSIGINDLKEFCKKADFVSRSIISFEFRNFHSDAATFAEAETWREIFLQPCTYPPPDDHPLSPNRKKPPDQPPASGA